MLYLPCREFQPGDCGLIVYVQDSRTHRLYPLGLFTGKSLRDHECGLTIYTAVPLQPCLDDVKESYDHLVSNLRPIEKIEDLGCDGLDLVPNLHPQQIGAAAGAVAGAVPGAVLNNLCVYDLERSISLASQTTGYATMFEHRTRLPSDANF